MACSLYYQACSCGLHHCHLRSGASLLRIAQLASPSGFSNRNPVSAGRSKAYIFQSDDACMRQRRRCEHLQHLHHHSSAAAIMHLLWGCFAQLATEKIHSYLDPVEWLGPTLLCLSLHHLNNSLHARVNISSLTHTCGGLSRSSANSWKTKLPPRTYYLVAALTVGE